MTFLRLLAAIFAFALPVWAQTAPTPTPTPSGPIQMKVESPLAITQTPLQLTGRYGRWFPISVTLSNTGDAVEGEVRLRLTTDSQFNSQPNEFYCPVSLPTTSNKQIWLYGRIERQEVNGVEVSFTGRGFTGLSERFPISPLESSQRLILNLTDTNEQLSYLASYSAKQLGLPEESNNFRRTGSNSPLQRVSATKDLVPNRWIGLDAVDLVILGDFPHKSLAPDQIAALRGYAHGGGNLLVPAGAQWQRLSQSPFADLWPLVPSASVPASSGEVASLVGRYLDRPRNGSDRLGGAPLMVTRGKINNDADLKDGSEDAPLFAVSEIGAGRCLFLSYDPTQPPFNGWRGLPSLWKDIIANCVRVPRLESVDANAGVNTSDFNGGMNGNPYNNQYPYNNGEEASTPTMTLFSAMSRAPQLRMPPVGQIAWFLALYVFFLVPVNYAVLRYFDRRELAWVTIPAIVGAFSLFAYSTAVSIRGRAILTRQTDIVQSSLNSKQGRTDSVLWLYSPRKTTYDIKCDGIQSAVADYAFSDLTSFSILQPTDGSSFVSERVGVLQWADRKFAAQSLVDLGRGVSMSGNKVLNGTPFDLRSAVVVSGGTVTKLGDLKTGQSAVLGKNDGLKQVSSELAGRVLAPLNDAKLFDADTRANNIPHEALAAVLGANWGKNNGESLLIAWGTGAATPISIGNGSPRSRDLTLFVFRIPQGQKRFASRESVVSLASWKPGDEAIYNCWAPKAKQLQLEVRGLGFFKLQILHHGSALAGGFWEGTSPALHIGALLPHSQAWKEVSGRLRQDNSPAGGWNFSAIVPGTFARQPDGLVQIRVSGGGGDKHSVSSVQLRAF